MSIGSALLTKENLDIVAKRSWKLGRQWIVDAGMRHYDEHPKEVNLIVDNLQHMGLPASGSELDTVLREIVVHYFEKLFVLVKEYEAFWIAKNRIDMTNSLEPFREAKETGKGVFIGQSHFGATYLMPSALAANNIDATSVGRFPEPVGDMLRSRVASMTERYGVGKVSLLDVGDEATDIPFEMMRLLRTGQIVSNVYDESNQFCRPVTLVGQSIMGGTGMDRILAAFSDEQIIVVTPFLIRTSDETFRYELDRHSLSADDIVSSFFASLEKRILDHFAQWYFIQEVHDSFV